MDTKMIDNLSKEYKIILLTKNTYVDYYQNSINDNIEIIGYDWNKFEKLRKKSIINRFLTIVRKLSSGKNYTDNTTNKVREIQYKYLLKKKKVFYFFCLLTSKFLNFSKSFRKIFNHLEKLNINTKYFDNLLNFHKPNAVFIGSCCVDHDAYISISAKKLNIKLASIIYSWDNPSTKGLAICKPDKVFSWNQVMSKDIENFYEIQKENISECGILHWSNYKDKLPIINRIDKEDTLNISFFSSSPSNFENSYSNLIDLLNYENSKKKVKIIARMHPGYFTDEKYSLENSNVQKYILEKFGKKIQFINPKITKLNNNTDFLMDLNRDLDDIKYILSISDIVVTQYSTILLEALILKKSLINYSTGNYRNTPYSKKKIFSSMHHLNFLLKYKLIKNIDTKNLLYTEIDEIVKKETHFHNYEKFFFENLSSTNKNNIISLRKEIDSFMNN
jgi:hypothetical protein